MWDCGDSVAVSVEQVAGVNRQAADGDGDIDGQGVAITVGADRSVGEGGEAEFLNFFEVSACSGCDDAFSAERFIGRTHDLAEGCRRDRNVEVLVNDDRRAGEF